MRRPRWSPEAIEDVASHVEWIEQFDVAAAARIADAIDLRACWLAEHPLAGQSLGDGGYRKFSVLGTRFLILYRPSGSTIEIVRVRHHSQDWRPR